MNRIRSFVLAVAATAFMGAEALAQVDAPGAVQPADPAPPPAVTTTPAPRDDGFSWGWIGPLGLLGLAGLMRRDAHPIDRNATDRATRTDSTTTPRGGPH
jgi:hypothetical protein